MSEIGFRCGTKVSASSILLPGFQVLKRRGEVVWLGRLGAPIEDAEFDEIVLHPSDYERIAAISTPSDSERK